MAISFKKYIDITSGVIAGQGVRNRDLITRIFSTNPLIPTNSFAEFTSFEEVANYFGTTAVESLMAEFYFAFISKTTTQPNKISFASWVQAATGPSIYGAANATATLAALKLITSGSLTLVLGGVSATASAINLGGAAALADIAALLQTAIRAAHSGTPWTTATVVYDVARGSFDLGNTTTGAMSVAVTTTPLSTAIGWSDVNTIISFGAAPATLTATMIASTAASNNFATFDFIPTLTQDQVVELANWNATQNNMYMQLVPVTASNASAMSAALINLPGGAMTLSPLSTEYPELFPGMILAASDYTRRNVSQNYMFQQTALTPSVTDDATSDQYDLLRVNYYGETQTAGQKIDFYQRGILTGLAVSPSDMNIYANEIWLKDEVGVAWMELLLAVNQVSTNSQGRATGIATILSVIDQALINGVISVGTNLKNSQIAVITSITGDDKAWRQIQSIGYWLDLNFQETVTIDGRSEWEAVYTLIYKKNDAIRKVVGTHSLV